MIKFFTSQELSQKLDIKLTRWKRWSREFLPPDPLGGLQSGYARQYNPDQAFTVFLGGYLVGDLKFTISEARRILHDLHDWLVARKFYFDYTGDALSTRENNLAIQYYQIVICRTADADIRDSEFLYCIKGVIADEWIDTGGNPLHMKRSTEWFINSDEKAAQINEVASYRVLNISILHDRFLNFLNDDKAAT